MHDEALGVAPLIGFRWDYLMVLITLLVLYLILRKFFFAKIKAFMDNRTSEIQKEYDDADIKLKETEQLRESYKIKVLEIENSRRNIIKNAK
ncbi:MAG: ATP synthase F0 subunit B, partial [Clostridiales Family XIII bacterium]|nr:ATP synthase F0 subunit B [Clostridiales Family XIII bacterium]